MPQRNYSDRANVELRLHDLDLSEEVLLKAVGTAVQNVVSCTLHDPPSLPGLLGWGRGIRSLREQLVPKGWISRNARNFATVEHPSGLCALTIAAGDAFTGLPDKNPSTRSAKGPATIDAIQVNQREFADIDVFPRVKPVSQTQTWILLYYSDAETDELRAELSLPAGMTSDGHVTVWSERVILHCYSPTTVPEFYRQQDEPESEIEVAVTRRRS